MQSTYCYKTFNRSDHPTNRVNIHTTDKPFDQSYTNLVSLSYYKLTHEKTQFDCTICRKS